MKQQKMTVREKMLLGLLGLLVLFSIYYFTFYVPTTDKIEACINENLALEDELIVIDATAEKKRMMEEELKAILAGEMGEIKELPAYDNSKNVMNQLSLIMTAADRYEINFSTVEQEDSIARRNVTLDYQCPTYEAAKQVLTQIYDSDYRCILKDVYMDYSESGENENRTGNYHVVVDITFFEYN